MNVVAAAALVVFQPHTRTCEVLVERTFAQMAVLSMSPVTVQVGAAVNGVPFSVIVQLPDEMFAIEESHEPD